MDQAQYFGFRNMRSRIVAKLYTIADICYGLTDKSMFEAALWSKIRINIHCAVGWSDYMILKNFPDSRGTLSAKDLSTIEFEHISADELVALKPSHFSGLCNDLIAALQFPFKDGEQYILQQFMPTIQKDILEAGWCLDTLYRNRRDKT